MNCPFNEDETRNCKYSQILEGENICQLRSDWLNDKTGGNLCFSKKPEEDVLETCLQVMGGPWIKESLKKR
jgi:hypothetical protein